MNNINQAINNSGKCWNLPLCAAVTAVQSRSKSHTFTISCLSRVCPPPKMASETVKRSTAVIRCYHPKCKTFSVLHTVETTLVERRVWRKYHSITWRYHTAGDNTLGIEVEASLDFSKWVQSS